MSASSRRKGARGERELRDLIRAAGFECERTGRSFDAPKDDLTHNIAGFHWEAKRRERVDIWAWLEQAARDAADRIPVVAFRRSRSRWYAVLPADALLALIARDLDRAD